MPKVVKSVDLGRLMFEVVPPLMHIIRQEMRLQAQPEYTVPQFRVLVHVRKGVKTTMELADVQGVAQPTMSKIVAGLVERGLLKKSQNLMDQRQYHIELTAKGRRELNRIRSKATQQVGGRFHSLSKSERFRLQNALNTIEDIMAASQTQRGEA